MKKYGTFVMRDGKLVCVKPAKKYVPEKIRVEAPTRELARALLSLIDRVSSEPVPEKSEPKLYTGLYL